MDSFLWLLILLNVIALLGLRGWWKGREVALVVINMAMILLIGGKLVTVFGFTTNAGNVCYVTVCLAQLLLAKRVGEYAAIRQLPNTAIVLIFLFLSVQFLAALPVLPGNEVVSEALQTIAQGSRAFAGASFLAYFFAQLVLIKTYFGWHSAPVWARYLVATILSQVADSIIFFPVAFGLESIRLGEIAVVGFAFKVALMACQFPVFYWVCAGLKDNRQTCDTCPVISNLRK